MRTIPTSRKPYASPLIALLIKNQWFSKGRVDLRTTKSMRQGGEIPQAVIALAATAVSDMCPSCAVTDNHTDPTCPG